MSYEKFYTLPDEITSETIENTARRALLNKAQRCIEIRDWNQAEADRLTRDALAAHVSGKAGRAAVLNDQAAGYVYEAESMIPRYLDFCRAAHDYGPYNPLLDEQIAEILHDAQYSAAIWLEQEIDKTARMYL